MLDEQRKKNIDKYGDKEDDVISRAYRESKQIGDVWCAKNAEKYLRRFIGSSHKSNNLADLRKAKDYIDRMLEQNEMLGQSIDEEIIEKP